MQGLVTDENLKEITQRDVTYMINKGYYNPHDTSKQLEVDMKTAETVLSNLIL